MCNVYVGNGKRSAVTLEMDLLGFTGVRKTLEMDSLGYGGDSRGFAGISLFYE